MAASVPIAIEITSLSKIYTIKENVIRAVDDLTLSIKAGQVFSFLGPNGAGKTTTIKMICGLISPSTGAIKLNGFDVARSRREAVAQIGVVLEGARNIHWRLSAWENLLYFGRLRGGSTKQIKQLGQQLLTELELWDRRHEQTRFFSRGMQQKIAIACALITDPPLILLDEPTLGLDIESAKIVENWLNALAHERGKTVLLTTHQLDMAQRVSDQVAVIRKGRLVANEPVSKLITLFQRPLYTIRLDGVIEEAQLTWLHNSTVMHANNETIIKAEISDQDALFAVLIKLRELNLSVIAVNRHEASLEEVFLRLLNEAPTR